MNKTKKIFIDFKVFSNLPVEDKKVILFIEKAHDLIYFKRFFNDFYNTFQIKILVLISDTRDINSIEELPFVNNVVFVGDGIIRIIYFRLLSGKVFFTTTPDIGNSELQKSNYNMKYFYLFHSLVSSHRIYNQKAFDNFDYILTAGPHHDKEIRKNEKVYKLKAKNLLHFGYPRILDMKEEYKNQLTVKHKTIILIAPTWGKWSISETCIDSLFDNLLKFNYELIFRPHPITVSKNNRLLLDLRSKYKDKVKFQYNINSTKFLKKVDILISDWSGFALEFHLTSKKNIIFIDTPAKVKNNEYKKLDIIPIEEQIRKKIGFILPINNIFKINSLIKNILNKNNIVKEITGLVYDYEKNKKEVFKSIKRYL